MIVGINARAFNNRGGIGRYSRALVRNLVSKFPDDKFLLFAHPGLDLSFLPPSGNWKFITVPGTSNRLLWELYSLPHVVNQHKPDVFHNPDYTVPRSIKAPCVVTVHDLSFKYFPDGVSGKARFIYNFLTPSSLKKSRIVMADSFFTKSEIIKAGWKDDEHIRVVHLAVDHELFLRPSDSEIDEILREYNLEKGYILYLGAIDKRKNITGLVSAYASLQAKLTDTPRLVIAGENIGGEAQLMDCILRNKLGGKVTRIGYIKPDMLNAIYSGAMIFVFPSFYEGFGLPPLEAMACGIPVITSDQASLPEVVSDAGITVPIDKPSYLTDAMFNLITDTDLRSELSLKGKDRAKKFTWDLVAENVMAVYREIKNHSK
jgi:glycosyltransferase involved in cell wall biosynthesis